MTDAPILAGLPWHWHGILPFERALVANLDLAAQLRGTETGAVLMFEPERPVLTLGRRAAKPEGRRTIASTIAACERRGIAVMDADRGGLATLHAPGQLVVFVALPPPTPSIPRLVTELLEGARALAGECGVDASLDLCRDVGLWRDASKLASVGLRIRDRVVLHGMSINIAIDPTFSAGLTLCGHDALDFASIQPHVTGLTAQEAVADAAIYLARHLRMRGAAGASTRSHA